MHHKPLFSSVEDPFTPRPPPSFMLPPSSCLTRLPCLCRAHTCSFSSVTNVGRDVLWERAVASLPPLLGEVLLVPWTTVGTTRGTNLTSSGWRGWQRGRRLRLWLWRGRFFRLSHLVCYCCPFGCCVTCFLVFLLWCSHTDASYFLGRAREFYW